MNNILKVENLSKFFGNQRLWNNVNLTLNAGESLSICGQSGSGKSTLLFSIGCLQNVDSGNIFFEKKEIKYNGNNAYINGISYIFQHYHLIQELSVEDNILIPAQMHTNVNMPKFMDKIIEALNLKHLLKKSIVNLSGGEKQRIAIARALIVRPKLLLADEPTGSLDEITGNNVMKMLLNLCKKQQIGLVLITHNYDFAKQTDKQFILQGGKLIKSYN